jgi:para-nitrobenzyl esterase
LTLLLAIAEPIAAFADETVLTTAGEVIGTREGASVAYRGIPYAEPPVGSLRWLPPIPHAGWQQAFNAQRFGAPCQQPVFNDQAGPAVVGDENCLTLNIAAPAGAGRESKLPVLFSIHGGGFITGSGERVFAAAPIFNGAGVVLVTFNYRLGPLGLFSHPGLPAPEGNNYALMDMVLALQWVHDNISAFGGDPDRVTIQGVSAGGQAVNMLMVSPLSSGLFDAAIAQSGYGTWPRQPRLQALTARSSSPVAEREGVAFVDRATGESTAGWTAGQLRRTEAQKLIAAIRGFHLPIIDGITLPEETGVLFARGRQHPVPYLTGMTSYDGSVFPGAGLPLDSVMELAGDHGGRVRELYAEDFRVSDYQGITRFFGDLRYGYSAWSAARSMRGISRPGYLYLFDYVPPKQRAAAIGASHGSDAMTMLTDFEADTARQMRTYWINFIRSGDPNGEGLQSWPTAAGTSTTRWLVLGETVRVTPDIGREKMALLDTLWRERTASLRSTQ